MSVSGRSSSCSVTQEEEVVKRMHKTPKAPIKSGQTTPRKSERKRSLFPSTSPNESDDLGLLSPLSPSSCSSSQSVSSPQFSPNGKFSTPPRTPNGNATPTRSSPRLQLKKIEIKSSLFPDLNVCALKTKRTPKTPKSLMAKLLTPQSDNSSMDNNKCLTTPTRRVSKRSLFKENIVEESDSSISVSSETQENEENEENLNSSSDVPTKLGIKPLSCESFYGSEPKVHKARTRLFIDMIDPRSSSKPLTRSLSKESLASNRSFVSGGSRKRTASNSAHRSKRSKSSGRSKGLQPGVWHNIKKPKQLKKIQAAEKPIISPKSRLAKMLNSPKKKEIKVKEKTLFQEYPRKRVSHLKKRSLQDSQDDFIIDSFPNNLLKRKKLPTIQSHPSTYNFTVSAPENLVPDPNKKFMKYGQTRKATFTLNENVKLQISDGIMKIQTPKKRRKLYSGKKDVIEDFNDFDEGDNGIQNSIQGILNILEDDQDQKRTKLDEKVGRNYENLGTNAFQNQKITPSITTLRPQRSPLKAVTNLPTMIMNDFESDEENLEPPRIPHLEKSRSEITLETTGSMVSYTTNILVNNDQDVISPPKPQIEETQSENSPPSQNKLYSLFYKQNWNKAEPADENNLKNNHNKKRILVPDDQYLLDAGQESIGIVTCKKCGVMYQAGDFADEATHNRFHNRLPELKFTGWLNERVVGKYPDGRVIMIISADPKAWWMKVAKIIEIVDQELGFPEATMKSLFYKTVYLYISEKSKQIAGCLIAEECNEAYKMYPPLEGVEIDSCSKDPSPCRVGISRIWTALSHRRKGVASRMIECLQRTFLFGDIVRMDEIAFSVPSPAGKLLAQKVTGRLDFLVYGFP